MRRTVRIIEEPGVGWTIHDGDRQSRHKAAALALRAVKAQDKALAQEAGVVVTTIKWEPSTSVGRTVARVLAGLTS